MIVLDTRVPAEDIVASTAEVYGLSVDAIMAQTRGKQRITEARHVAMAALERSGYNPTEIGRALGRHGHSAVPHGLRRVHADADLSAKALAITRGVSAPLVAAMALTMLSVPERCAVGRYLTDMLLAERPARGTSGLAGIWVLAGHPDLLARLATALVNVEHVDCWRESVAGITQRITHHIRAAGYGRAASVSPVARSA